MSIMTTIHAYDWLAAPSDHPCLTVSFPPLSWAAASYEDSLKQLAEDVTERAAKAKKQRLAVLDFTDSQENRHRLDNFSPKSLGRKSWWQVN